jgi:hypothetical protein
MYSTLSAYEVPGFEHLCTFHYLHTKGKVLATNRLSNVSIYQ